MNSLSWMIYLTEVVSRLVPLATVGGVFLLVGGMAAAFLGSIGWSYYSWDGPEARAKGDALQVSLRKWGIRAISFAPILIAVALLTPTAKTVYLIAASEAGEAVVTSPEAKEMLGDLKEIIRKRLKEELNEEVGV